MKYHIPGAVLAAVLLAAPLASPALASDHMDFQRTQCNSDRAAFEAQILGCTRIARSDRFGDPAKGVAFYNLGVAYGKNEQLEKAMENYDKAIDLNPDDAEAIFNRDLALRILAKPGEKIDEEPHGKKEVTRSDLPEDMRRVTTRDKATQTKQGSRAIGKRKVRKQKRAKRTRMDRKKIE
ncbi:MAG: tetratricopeptide repeat protein [Proteobacteria bacterium]|nr:tetratricopeptide repeat protein [Pseudomonadota bacterium]